MTLITSMTIVITIYIVSVYKVMFDILNKHLLLVGTLVTEGSNFSQVAT